MERQTLKSIDINCDMGESYGRFKVGDCESIMPLITSANIACGFHAGDPRTIETTITLALEHGIQIGAHPSSCPDLVGFGRRAIDVPLDELSSNIKYQVGALLSLVASHGGELSYVKPHGALYHSIQTDSQQADCVVAAIAAINPNLKLLAANSEHLRSVCSKHQISLVAEGFADRRYRSNGQLVPRSEKGSVITNSQDVADQAVSLAVDGSVTCQSGQEIPLSCDSLCIHGDTPAAVALLQAIRQAMDTHGVALERF